MVQIAGRDPSLVEGVAGEQGVGDLQQILGGRFGRLGDHVFTNIHVDARVPGGLNVATEATQTRREATLSFGTL
ncbi:hypothetical protein ACWDA3_47700 [Nonomuraea rubra]